MRNKSLLHLAICVWVGWGMLACATEIRAEENPNIEKLLTQFEKKISAETANKFMNALFKEQFIENPVRFDQKMPLDSMRQQVYYWAGEWLYDKQNYQVAQHIAERSLF